MTTREVIIFIGDIIKKGRGEFSKQMQYKKLRSLFNSKNVCFLFFSTSVCFIVTEVPLVVIKGSRQN